MQEDNFPDRLRAVEDPRRSLRRLDAKFEQAATQRTRMRHTKVRPVLLHTLRVTNQSREETARQFEKLGLELSTEEDDFPSHEQIISYLLF
jgi:hypothetical protein